LILAASWSKVSMDNCPMDNWLLGQKSPWTTVSWKNVFFIPVKGYFPWGFNWKGAAEVRKTRARAGIRASA